MTFDLPSFTIRETELEDLYEFTLVATAEGGATAMTSGSMEVYNACVNQLLEDF